MTTFDKREKAFEDKFAHDLEFQFKATARRNKLFGLWAAKQMNLQGGAAEDYALSVVQADFELPGDHDVLQKVMHDFARAGLTLTAEEVELHMHNLLIDAKEQMFGEIS